MKKQNILLIMMSLFMIGGGYLFLAGPQLVLGQDATIPTRTPTPGSQPTDEPPPPPTATRDDGGGGPDPTTVPPTNTPIPTNTLIPATSTAAATATTTTTATATVDPSATASATPDTFPGENIVFPTAEACGDSPTIETLTTVTVYEGPGSDYPVVRTLGEEEVYPIVGRAEFAEWWLIQLNRTGDTAWISDAAGIVRGYTGNVPLVDAPAINGETPTPDVTWEPTAVPGCTVTPTPTSTSTASPTATSTNSENSTTAVESTETPEPTAVATDDPSSGDSDDSSTTLTSGNAESDNLGSGIPTAVPLEGESSQSGPNAATFLPIIGLVLIAAAVFVVIFIRRGSSGGGTETGTPEE